MRKIIAVLLAMLMVAVPTTGVLAQEGPLPDMLADAEQAIYGQDRSGSLIERISRLERDVYGEEEDGPLLVRVQNIHAYLTGARRGAASLAVQLNVVEYLVFQRLTTGTSLTQRIGELERGIYGNSQSGAIAERAANLVELFWPTGDINVRPVSVPEETLVKVRLLTEINSSRNDVGDRIAYRVVEDVKIDDRVVIPAGAQGEGRVTSVQRAGRFGQAGRVGINWGNATTFDMSEVKLAVSERAAEENQELAVAASVAGLVLLGPIGLAGGFLVQGRDHVVTVGTEFFVEVEREVDVLGLSLTPVRD